MVDNNLNLELEERKSYLPGPKPLTHALAEKALDLLQLSLSHEQKKSLIQYMRDSYSKNSCLVLYSAPGTVSKNFLDNIGIDLGKKELVINEKASVFFTQNYVVKPKLVLV